MGKVFDVIIFSLLYFGIFLLGWGINDVYKIISLDRELDGLNIRERSYENALETSQDLDEMGDWVCINVKGMDYRRAIETCQHEVGHEIFAEITEDNPEIIQKVLEVAENEK